MKEGRKEVWELSNGIKDVVGPPAPARRGAGAVWAEEEGGRARRRENMRNREGVVSVLWMRCEEVGERWGVRC